PSIWATVRSWRNRRAPSGEMASMRITPWRQHSHCRFVAVFDKPLKINRSFVIFSVFQSLGEVVIAVTKANPLCFREWITRNEQFASKICSICGDRKVKLVITDIKILLHGLAKSV
ncbi:hypothetical protein, partial [Altericroceibacterium endophyticum]|uniref:hypothetical protein n=1 Tax=Altericroceibacterium endophyticum TaxID=1808508 RepID=UPI001F27540A